MPLPIALDYRPALLSRSGIGRAVRELAAALAERDDLDVHLFGHSLARCGPGVTIPPRAALHRLPIPGRTLPLWSRLGLGADRLAGGASVFHWTDYVQPPVTHARIVFTVHDLAFERDATWHGSNAPILRERTRRAIARATAIVVPSASTAADVRAFAPDAPLPRIVPFGADHVDGTSHRHPLGGRPYALCLGTIEPRKNHRTLLAAWRQLPKPRPLLVVVGQVGWACDDITAAMRDAGQEGLVDWRSSATDDEVWALLQHAELLVYPSSWEGFGFPPLEAMQLGVPVVAGDIAPLHELGDDAMVYADGGDSAALAAAVDRLLHDPLLRAACQSKGIKRAAGFRWRDCAAAHAAIYREVAP